MKTTSARCPGCCPNCKCRSMEPSSRWRWWKTSWTSTNCSTTPICARFAPERASTWDRSPSIHQAVRHLDGIDGERSQVTHSLVDCVALAIHTPLGVIIHTGDFKVDPTPTDNRLFDLHTFAEYGKERVLLLMQDSTNVERSGYTPSERAVRPRFEEVFTRTKRRLFVTCFSSSIHRIK